MNLRPRAVRIYASAIARLEMYGIFMLIFLLHVHHTMTSLTLTFDPVTPKTQSENGLSHMYTRAKSEVDPSHSSQVTARTSHFHVFYELCDLEL